eukprot:XP_014018769.1 PREDICTED: rho GTPase-activating protein gacK-like [Salmo salar]
MPLEQAYLSGREPHASSKTTKDRSNTATLLASRSTAVTESIGRGSRSGSEKDSGYSVSLSPPLFPSSSPPDNNSCSDWLHADGEDRGSSLSEPRGREGLQGQVKPKQVPLQGNDFLVRSPGGPDLTPIFIIKNVVFKQNKRICTEDKRDEVSTITHLQTPSRQHVRKQPDPKRSLSHWRSPASSHSPSPSSRSPSSLSCLVSPSVSASSSGGSSPLPASRWPCRHSPGLSLFSVERDRRFLNTVGILSQSGLLDITLRTQDLLRQSNATDRDIAQLRQHTQLLYQAANQNNNPNNDNPYNNNDPHNNNPNANTGWERIHQAMAQSGCYPSLKNLGSEEDTPGYGSVRLLPQPEEPGE